MAFISEIVDYIIDNKLDTSSLTIIFPNKRAALMLRKELSRRFKKSMWLPQILSIQEAVSLWSNIQLLDDIDVVFSILEIMNNNTGDFSNTNNLFGLANQIAKDFDEIDQYAVDAAKLFEYIKDIKEVETWSPDRSNNENEIHYINFFKSLHAIYLSLSEKLNKEGCGYYGLVTRYLYELPKEDLLKLVGKQKIIFAGFNAMTITEESIITRLIDSDIATIIWDIDDYYYSDERQEAGMFARIFFKNHPELKPKNLPKNFLEKEKNINIIEVSGSAIQANALQAMLSKEIDEKKETDNEVVVLSDESLLIPVLNSIPAEYNRIQVTMGYPYSETVIHLLVSNIFSLQNALNDDSVYFWTLKRFTENEFIKLIFTYEESYLLSKCIDKFAVLSVYHLDFNIFKEELKNQTDNYPEAACNIYNFFNLLLRKWKSNADCFNGIKDILRFIKDCVKTKAESSENVKFIYNQIICGERIIKKIEQIMNKHNSVNVQIPDIETLYMQSAAELSLKLKNDNKLDGLQIMGLLETRNLDFDTIHLLSVNEGILPQSKSNNTLIPYDLRKHYRMPVYTNKQAVYAYHFYRLIQNASTVNIYFNSLSDGMGEGEESRFIKQLLHELPDKMHNINIKRITYKNPEISSANTNTALIVKKDEQLIEEIKEKLQSGLSPTSIASYLKCPIQFYFKYIKKINDNPVKEEIGVNIVGSIIHLTLENLYKKFNSDIIDSALFEYTLEKNPVKELIDSSIKELLPNGFPNRGFNSLIYTMIEKLTNNFIEYEREFLKKNIIRIIGLEQELKYNFKIEHNNEEIEVKLKGTSDRIDEIIYDNRDSIVRIIDYKSGNIDYEDVRIKSSVSNFADMTEKSQQLMIYKYLYSKNHCEIKPENIKPGIFGLLKLKEIDFPLENESEIFNDEFFSKNCDIFFRELYENMLNKDIDFMQTDDSANCQYCSFKEICKR